MPGRMTMVAILHIPPLYHNQSLAIITNQPAALPQMTITFLSTRVQQECFGRFVPIFPDTQYMSVTHPDATPFVYQ